MNDNVAVEKLVDVPQGSGAGARAHRTDGLAEVGAVPLSRPRLTTCGSQGGSRLTPPPRSPHISSCSSAATNYAGIV